MRFFEEGHSKSLLLSNRLSKIYLVVLVSSMTGVWFIAMLLIANNVTKHKLDCWDTFLLDATFLLTELTAPNTKYLRRKHWLDEKRCFNKIHEENDDTISLILWMLFLPMASILRQILFLGLTVKLRRSLINCSFVLNDAYSTHRDVNISVIKIAYMSNLGIELAYLCREIGCFVKICVGTELCYRFLFRVSVFDYNKKSKMLTQILNNKKKRKKIQNSKIRKNVIVCCRISSLFAR